MFICTFRISYIKQVYGVVIIMAIVIDQEKCGKIKNCPGEGLCIKLCEKGAIIEENGDVVLVPEKCD